MHVISTYSLCSSCSDGIHDSIHVQVALIGGGRADTHSLISHLYMNLDTQTHKHKLHLDRHLSKVRCRLVLLLVVNPNFYDRMNTNGDSQHWSQHHCEQLQCGCPSFYMFWSPDGKTSSVYIGTSFHQSTVHSVWITTLWILLIRDVCCVLWWRS